MDPLLHTVYFVFIYSWNFNSVLCKAYGHPFAMPGGPIPADPSGGFNKYPGEYPPHLFGPASPLPFPYTTSSPLPFFHLPQGKKMHTQNWSSARNFFLFSFLVYAFGLGKGFFFVVIANDVNCLFLIIYKGYASMGAPTNAASGPSSATDLNRAFLQSAVVQNMQIQQQLMAQNQALQQLLQAVRSIHETHSISTITHFLALSIFFVAFWHAASSTYYYPCSSYFFSLTDHSHFAHAYCRACTQFRPTTRGSSRLWRYWF